MFTAFLYQQLRLFVIQLSLIEDLPLQCFFIIHTSVLLKFFKRSTRNNEQNKQQICPHAYPRYTSPGNQAAFVNQEVLFSLFPSLFYVFLSEQREKEREKDEGRVKKKSDVVSSDSNSRQLYKSDFSAPDSDINLRSKLGLLWGLALKVKSFSVGCHFYPRIGDILQKVNEITFGKNKYKPHFPGKRKR